MFVYYHYSSYSHRNGLETANLYFISPPTFLFNATPSAIAVIKILLHYGRWFPAYFISSICAENQTWVNKFLGFCIRRNIFLDKMDIGISGGKNKNITVLYYLLQVNSDSMIRNLFGKIFPFLGKSKQIRWVFNDEGLFSIYLNKNSARRF